MLRLALTVLITLNVLFTVYVLFVDKKPVTNDRMARQIAADQIAIVSLGKHPSISQTAAQLPSPPIDQQCLVWAGLNHEALEQLEKMPQSMFANLVFERSEIRDSDTFWVYVSDFASRAEAERYVAELKRQNVDDYYIVPANTAGRYVISLGIFSTESAAHDRLQEVQLKGVKNARVEPREGKNSFNLLVRGSNGQVETWLHTAQEQVQGGDLKDCKDKA